MIFSLTAFFLFNEELLQQGKFVFMTLQFKEQDDSEGIGDKIKEIKVQLQWNVSNQVEVSTWTGSLDTEGAEILGAP